MAPSRATYVLATLGMVLGTSGHIGDEMAAHSPEPTTETAAEEAADTYPPTYFTLNIHQVEIRAHITLMILSWFILLPIGKSPGFSIFLLQALPLTHIASSDNAIAC